MVGSAFSFLNKLRLYMKKIVESIRKRPVNLMLLILVVFAYWINNLFLKEHSGGLLRVFFIGYFNDLICPLFFFSYANMLLITVGKEIARLWVICLVSLCTSCVWEFVAPLMKPSSTTDPLDIFCYITGGVVYWAILRYIKNKTEGTRE
jgi:ABC-type proline/glycine betaine transport system permease subunit